MSSKRKIIILVVVIVVFIGAVSLIISSLANHYGDVTLSFSLPDTKGLEASINGKPLKISSLRATYKIPDGAENLVVIKPNYQQFTTSFNLEKGQTVYISVAMQSTAPQSSTVATSQVQAALTGLLPQGFSIQQTAYFYGNTWVVAFVQTNYGDPAVLVAEYVGSSNTWKIVLGPGTVFTPSDLTNVPSAVSTYLSQQGFVLEVSQP